MKPIDKDRLKLAVQKSGRLTDPSLELLKSCGLKLSRGRDQLMGFGENMPLDVLFVRDDDIPDLVQEDVCDLGLVGRNVLEEKRLELISRGHAANFTELRTLDYGRCRLSLAVPEGFSYEGPRTLAGKRIATTYPFTLERWLNDRAITADIVTLSGAVEIAPRLGRADVICDLVSTGSTLQANHLREVETVLESQALLIRTPVALSPAKQEWVERLLLRIDGVQQVRESKYIMLHAPRSALTEIRRLLPGSESPTIIPLEGSNDLVAIHAVCRENVFWETLESLKKAGASSLLVLPVEKMLAVKIIDWTTSSPDARRAALARPAADSREEVFREATAIIAAVRAEGDAAVRRFTKQFGGAALEDLQVAPQEFREAARSPETSADRGARARGRQRREFSPGAGFRAVVGGNHARRSLRTHHAPHRQRRPLRARGFRAAALHRHHAGRARAYRGMPVARDRKLARTRRQTTRRGAGGRRAVRCGHRLQDGRRAGHRRTGVRYRQRSQGRQDLRTRQRLGHGRQTDRRGGSGRCRHRSARRPFRGAGDRGRIRQRAVRRRGSARAGRTRHHRAGRAGDDLDGARRRR